MKQTAIVILNWNGKKFLQDFIPFVLSYSGDDAELIIADNASTDGSVDWLREAYPRLRIIQNSSNGGFAKGYNDALFQLDHKYFILLNSDIEVTEAWTVPLIAQLESDPGIFAVQPKLLSYDQRTHFEYAGASGGFIDLLGFPFCRGRIFESLEEDRNQYDSPMEVFWATGACMAVRAEAFKSIGGFDEDFFAHMEEIDLCWRARSLGWKVICDPASRVFHIGGGTLPKQSFRKTYLNFRNNLLMLYKNLPTGHFFLLLPPKLLLDGVAAFKFLLSGQYKDFWAVLRAHLSFYRRLAAKKRSPVRSALQSLPGTYHGIIVYQHYARGVKYFSDIQRIR